jgi:hypothetical protein
MFMNVAMWEHCTFDNEIFKSGKIYCFNSIIITNFVQSFIPNCRLKIVLSAYFGI